MSSLRSYASSFHVAPVVMAALISVLMSASVDHSNLVADLPVAWTGIGLRLPMWVYHTVLPVTVLICFALAVRFASLGRGLGSMLKVLVCVAIGLVWLQGLVRQDPLLSLAHGSILTMALWLSLSLPRFVKTALSLAVGLLIVAVTYGAVKGETRCNENGHVTCLTDEGLRYWVPLVLDRFGMSPFADLRNADLRGADLRFKQLRYADFTGADLSGADLSDAYLRRARLDRIDAEGSSWNRAYLDGATMIGAQLRGSNLRGIHAYRLDLQEANLADVDASGANLSHVKFRQTGLSGLNLSGAYLRFSENLEPEQLALACGDTGSRLSPGFTIDPCGAAMSRVGESPSPE